MAEQQPPPPSRPLTRALAAAAAERVAAAVADVRALLMQAQVDQAYRRLGEIDADVRRLSTVCQRYDRLGEVVHAMRDCEWFGPC